jgi:hypothetical protein
MPGGIIPGGIIPGGIIPGGIIPIFSGCNMLYSMYLLSSGGTISSSCTKAITDSSISWNN